MRRITGILLAAGCSRRYGSNKLLAPLADGTPLAIAAARRLRSALDEVVAVVRCGDMMLARLLAAEGLRVVECVYADQGMGVSLATGVAALPAAQGWLVALADMPYIQVSTCVQVARAVAEGAPLAAPFHCGVRGHPVGFGPGFREALQGLRGDRGARDLVVAHVATLMRIEVDDSGVLTDVDTAADLGRVTK